MPPFSYKKAEATGAISEADLKRIASMFFVLHEQTRPTQKDYALAAVGVDSTQGSMQVLIGKLFKKLRENDCFITEEDEADSKDAMKKRKVDGIKDGDSDATDEHPKPKRIVVQTKAVFGEDGQMMIVAVGDEASSSDEE